MGTLIRDGVKIGGTTVYVDSNLSTTSENPVENKIVTSALNEKANTSSLANVATTGSYNDLSNTPTIDNTLSTESTNAVQNKVITNSLDEKYPIDYDVALSLAEWEALGDEKYYNHKNYYIYDAGTPTEKTTVYGWHVDPNESDPTAAVSYIKEAVGMTPASMGATNFNYGSWQNAFFMPKPCMVKENGEVDYYLDENDYTKKKDTITITSSPVDELPLSFNSTDTGIVAYKMYGKTVENLFDYTATDTNNGYMPNKYLKSNGEPDDSSNHDVSEYIEIEPNTIYTLILPQIQTAVWMSFYDSNKTFIQSVNEGVTPNTITSPTTAKYLRITIRKNAATEIMLTKGSTAPTRYVPYGTPDGVGEETENLAPLLSEWEDGYISANGWIGSASDTNKERYSPKIFVEPNATYQWAYEAGQFPSGVNGAWSGIGWYDDNGFISRNSGVVNTVLEVVAPANATYARLSFRTYDESYNTMFIKSSTPPDHYIPYGYKLPLTVESGETENKFDKDAETTLSGDTRKYVIQGLVANEEYTVSTNFVQSGTVASIYYNNGQSALGFVDSEHPRTSLSDNDGQVWVAVRINSDGTAPAIYDKVLNGEIWIMLTKGSIPPEHYIPHRYTTDIPIYIGDSKLGEEEYVDYGEQKVYKRTAQLFNSDELVMVDNYYINENGETYAEQGYGYTENYFDVLPNETYSFINFYNRMVNTGCRLAFYDAQGNFLSRTNSFTPNGTNNKYTFTTASNCYKFRILYRMTLFPASNTTIVQGSITPDPIPPYYQPTDPPVPLPKINAYQGENTLSSTETVGDVTIFAKSDIDDLSYNGNAMIEWPLIWWKYEAGKVDGEGSFYVSNRKIDNTYNCWCNYDSKNNIISNFYTAIYNGGIYNGKLRSMSGYKLITKTSTNYSNTSTYAINDIVLYNSNMYICITDIETPEDFDNNKWVQIPINGGTTATQEINSAIANNTTSDVEWYIDTWSDRMLINGLLILMGKSLNSQAVFGRGLDTGGQTAKEAYVTGTLNDKGMFWGDTSVGTSGVKVFGMENWWSCVWHRTAGLIGLSNGNTAYKMTYGTADGTTANEYNTTGDGYYINTVARPSQGYVKNCKFGNFGYLPLTTGGGSSTYYADYWYTNNSTLTFALVGGDSGSGLGGGVFYVRLGNGADYAFWSFAAALTLKPLIE